MLSFQALTLPNGSKLNNRFAKAAMEENMANSDHSPSDALIGLYRVWAGGGVGLIITGNVMIDSRAMTGPGAVVLENDKDIERFKKWASVGRSQGTQLWMQINHPGRQTQANLGQEAWAPSAVPLELGSFSRMFAVPREMSEAQIVETIRRFANSARLAEIAGFTGIQIHAAHGYLISQFLSPLTNKRNDKWGGSLENRARLLIEVVKAVREQVSAQTSVAVKLNSADFQRGGFAPEESKEVVQMLNSLSIDLVEISGGSYESPATQGDVRDGRTLAREAYFLEFAKDIATVANMPLMVTGGIKRLTVAEDVLASGIDVVGMGTALALNPKLPNEWRTNDQATVEFVAVKWKIKPLAALATMAKVKYHLHEMGKGKNPDRTVSALRALLWDRIRITWLTRKYRLWMKKKLSASA